MRQEALNSRSRIIGAALTAVVCLVLAACSSSGSNSAGSGASDAGNSSSRAAGVAQAKAFVAQHTRSPASIAISVPLPKRPPTGVTIARIQDNGVEAAQETADIKAAAAALGWKVEVVTTQATPEAEANAVTTALEHNPDAVLTGGFPRQAFAQQIAEMKARHIAYVDDQTTDCSTVCDYKATGVVANIQGPVDDADQGKWAANWVIADSSGAAHAVLWNLSTFTINQYVVKGYEDTTNKLCPDCQLDVQDVAFTSIGTTFPSQVVTYLQAHPDVNYMVLSAGLMSQGLQAALDSAGLAKRVKIADVGGGPANLANIKSGGSEKVFVSNIDAAVGWMMVDAVARWKMGAPVPETYYNLLTREYFTQSNISGLSGDPATVPDYQQQFKRLWHV